eukprot:ANDGO_00452.mRNA.1 Mannosyl-oligosaccharide glucosidase GCS1
MTSSLLIFRTNAPLALAMALLSTLSLLSLLRFTRGSASVRPDDVLYWGSYRPQVYFGMRNRDSEGNGVSTGLMWQRNRYSAIHDTCSDSASIRYGWKKHDGASFGVQDIVDAEWKNRPLAIATSFIKTMPAASLSTPKTIAVSTEGVSSIAASQPLENGAGDVETSPFLNDVSWLNYFATNDSSILYYYMWVEDGHSIKISHSKSQYSALVDSVAQLYVDGESATSFWAVRVNHVARDAFRVSQVIFNHIMQHETGRLPNKVMKSANLVVFQKVCDGPCTWTTGLRGLATFRTSKPKIAFPSHMEYGSLLNRRIQNFDRLFGKTFRAANNVLFQPMLEYAFSNLIGGMGYFYGTYFLKDGRSPGGMREVGPTDLFTAVPSRSFFPRGFLWDEGFMQLLVASWNPQLSYASISGWLQKMDADGWIPREQILGDEARSRVPMEFVPQDKTHVNPPTFFLWLEFLLDHGSRDDDQDQFLAFATPLLQRHYNYIRTSQRNPMDWGYQWQGRTPDHLLASGFDDYPRSDGLDEENDRHLDLICWLYMAARSLDRLENRTRSGSVAGEYRAHMQEYLDELSSYYWNKDFGMHTDWNSTHIGYVTLFPLIAGILDASSREFDTILKLIRSEDYLWTPFGLASLARNDRLFQSGENYWRGSIWINVQYLVLRSLHRNYVSVSRAAKILYHELRGNVLHNLANEFSATGFLWEQYHPLTGRGLRSRPFTGWTSLVVLIHAELY